MYPAWLEINVSRRLVHNSSLLTRHVLLNKCCVDESALDGSVVDESVVSHLNPSSCVPVRLWLLLYAFFSRCRYRLLNHPRHIHFTLFQPKSDSSTILMNFIRFSTKVLAEPIFCRASYFLSILITPPRARVRLALQCSDLIGLDCPSPSKQLAFWRNFRWQFRSNEESFRQNTF